MNSLYLAIALVGLITPAQAQSTCYSEYATLSDGIVHRAINLRASFISSQALFFSSALSDTANTANYMVQSKMYTYESAWSMLNAAYSQVNNQDALIIIELNAQLIDMLSYFATVGASRVPLGVSTIGFALSLLYDTDLNAEFATLASNSALSCEVRNSLSSQRLVLSSLFSELSASSWMSTYLYLGVTLSSITGCENLCATTSTSTSDSSTLTATATSTEIISTQTRSGTTRRCIVRPTTTTSATLG